MPRTISDNLIRLEQAKTDIGTAINSYGFDTPSNSTLTTYPTTINTIGTDINGTLETCLGTGSGHSIVVDKTITTNGVYNPLDDNAYAYDEVTVNVANSYEESDEGKVVSNGALVAQTAYPSTITENGTYNTTENNSVTVDISTTKIITFTADTNNAYAILIDNYIYIFGQVNISSSATTTFTSTDTFGSLAQFSDKSVTMFTTQRYYSSNQMSAFYNSISTNSSSFSVAAPGSADFPTLISCCFSIL